MKALQNIAGTCSDKAGNTANTSVTVNLDKTVPQFTGNVPRPGCQRLEQQ